MVSIFFFLSLNLVSNPAPLSGLNLANGKVTTLRWEKGQKYRVIAFLSSKCPCSKSHEAKLQTLAAQYKSAGIQFVAVDSNQDEDWKAAQDHFSKSHFSIPVLQDPRSKIADRFGAEKTPQIFIVDASGKTLYQGGIDDSSDASKSTKEYLADALQNLKEGKPIQLTETTALGCRISRP